jgi:RNA polymerase sigma-70 factor (ECF subfamily)
MSSITPSSSDAAEDRELLERLGLEGVAELFTRYEDRLRRMVQFRLDRRLASRIDASDVLQEVYLVAARRYKEYIADPAVSYFVWLRAQTLQILVDVHRHHFGAQMRDVNREVSMHRPGGGPGTSLSLAARLVGNLTSPSQAVIREELLEELRNAFEGMDEIDREVLALRHFEELSNNEVAEILGLQKSAASNRYVRALKRLRQIMSKVSDER